MDYPSNPCRTLGSIRARMMSVMKLMGMILVILLVIQMKYLIGGDCCHGLVMTYDTHQECDQ